MSRVLFYQNYINQNALRVITEGNHTIFEILKKGVVKGKYLCLKELKSLRLVRMDIGNISFDREYFEFSGVDATNTEHYVRVYVVEDEFKTVTIARNKKPCLKKTLDGGEYFWQKIKQAGNANSVEVI